MFTDMDEFITVNLCIKSKTAGGEEGQKNPLYQSRGAPDLGKKNSLLEWLEAEH
jgi:hypothetical protein